MAALYASLHAAAQKPDSAFSIEMEAWKDDPREEGLSNLPPTSLHNDVTPPQIAHYLAEMLDKIPQLTADTTCEEFVRIFPDTYALKHAWEEHTHKRLLGYFVGPLVAHLCAQIGAGEGSPTTGLCSSLHRSYHRRL